MSDTGYIKADDQTYTNRKMEDTIMEYTIDAARGKRLYSAFRAYCFFNFTVLGLMALILGLTQLAGDTVFGGGLMAMGLMGLGIAYLFWLPVAKRVSAAARRAVFLNFCAAGTLAFGKALLMVTLVLIPFAIKIGSDSTYEEMLITTGPNAGQSVVVRYIGNGQYQDTDGNYYRAC